MNAQTATLYVFSGLPGSGKSTLAQLLAEHLGAAYVRIDTLEQGLRDLCSVDVQGEGYALAYRVAADNLRLGVSVVADSCNPIELTRRAWERVGAATSARCLNIEIVCSDVPEHRRRVETRPPTVPGLKLPTWQEVVDREYDTWTDDRIVIDTFGRPERSCLDELVAELAHRGADGVRVTSILSIDHVQLAMPAGREREARAFYSGLLGIPETPKPAALATRGGAWFETATVKIHLGVDADFRPARKAHPALLVRGLRALADRLRKAGVEVVENPLDGHLRIYVADPFGNRLELMERISTGGS